MKLLLLFFKMAGVFFIKDTLIILNLHLIYTIKINIVIEL